MGGFLIIEDGRGICPTNWAFDGVIDAIAQELPATTNGNALREWLLSRRCKVVGVGCGSVDVRELTPSNQELFWKAAQSAFARSKIEGPRGWSDPSFFPKWLELFRNLMRMRKLYLRREPPEEFNPYFACVIPESERRSGPGWNTLDG
jgi:hypothetical protein